MKKETLPKKQLIADFIAQLEKEVLVLKNAAIATHDAATNEESRPENQYDTRALEASYLAGAQSKRVSEVQEVIALFRNLMFKDFTAKDPIDLTALVVLEVDGKKSTVLVLPIGGGVSLEHGTARVQIITPQSILGETLMGLHVGDTAEFEVGSVVRECEIMEIA